MYRIKSPLDPTILNNSLPLLVDGWRWLATALTDTIAYSSRTVALVEARVLNYSSSMLALQAGNRYNPSGMEER